jgi:integrase/recombinase XerD
MQEANLNLIESFVDVLRVEKNLSKNTVENYRRDLQRVTEFLGKKGRKKLAQATELDIRRFLSAEFDRGQKGRSTARRLTTLRMFFRHLVREKAMKIDPTLKVDLPKLGRSLPKFLTFQEVEDLMAQPDIKKDLGRRDRAMLETIYASGLRV